MVPVQVSGLFFIFVGITYDAPTRHDCLSDCLCVRPGRDEYRVGDYDDMTP